MRTITVEPQNPRDIPPDDLSSLVDDLRERLPDYAVELAPGAVTPAGARGVTWWEVFHVYLPMIADDARGAVVGIIVTAAYVWARDRFKRRRGQGVDKRPKAVIVHRADGSEETTMVLLSPRHKPKTAEQARRTSPPRKRRKKQARTTEQKSIKKGNRQSRKRRT